VDHPLLDTKTIATSKKIKEILNKKAVNVSFYNSNIRYKLLQHKINWQEILVTTTIDKH
jgi:hypothetical protein